MTRVYGTLAELTKLWQDRGAVVQLGRHDDRTQTTTYVAYIDGKYTGTIECGVFSRRLSPTERTSTEAIREASRPFTELPDL